MLKKTLLTFLFLGSILNAANEQERKTSKCSKTKCAALMAVAACAALGAIDMANHDRYYGYTGGPLVETDSAGNVRYYKSQQEYLAYKTEMEQRFLNRLYEKAERDLEEELKKDLPRRIEELATRGQCQYQKDRMLEAADSEKHWKEYWKNYLKELQKETVNKWYPNCAKDAEPLTETIKPYQCKSKKMQAKQFEKSCPKWATKNKEKRPKNHR